MEEHHEHSDEQGGFIEKRIDGAREFDEQEGGGWGGEKACAIKREREDDDEYDSERQRWDDSVKDEHEYECEEEEEEEDADERPDVFQYGMTCSSNELDELIRTHVMPIIRAWKNPTNVETAERCINALLSLPPDDDEQQHRPDEQQQQRAPWRRPQQPTLEYKRALFAIALIYTRQMQAVVEAGGPDNSNRFAPVPLPSIRQFIRFVTSTVQQYELHSVDTAQFTQTIRDVSSCGLRMYRVQ